MENNSYTKFYLLEVVVAHPSRYVQSSMVLKDGEVSDQLKIGDELSPRTEFNALAMGTASEEQMFWCYGFVYGDGTGQFWSYFRWCFRWVIKPIR